MVASVMKNLDVYKLKSHRKYDLFLFVCLFSWLDIIFLFSACCNIELARNIMILHVYLWGFILYSYSLSVSEYGFAEKVVEGISLSVNSIVIRISAKAFNASFELSQLQVLSVNTSWATGDLRYTRILDPTRGEVTHLSGVVEAIRYVFLC